MKYYLSDIVDTALTGDKAIYFSTVIEDKIIHHRSEEATFAERKKELEKVKSYNEQMMIHFIMIFFPNNQLDNISVNKNKSDLINKWMKKITQIFLKSNSEIKPSDLKMDIDYKYLNKIKNILIKDHNYNPLKNFNLNKIRLKYSIFFAAWDKLVLKSKEKKKIPTNEDYENILNELEV